MKKIILMTTILFLMSYAANAADEVQLLSDEMFLSDSETAEIDANVDQDKDTDGESGGFFGFIRRPFSKLFSGGDTAEESAETESALDKMIHAADKGDLESQMDLAYIYLYGDSETEQDFEKALHYYTLAADQKDPVALNNLGSLYFSGIGTTGRNIKKALRLFSEAAALGNDNAALNLAFIYLTGGKKDASRNQRAIKLFEQAQAKNNIAKFMLGYAYYKGFVVPQNYEKAFQLVKEAADDNSQIDEAQLVLAQMYAEGKGTVQNYQNAINSYRSAVSQSNMEAVMTLAQIYVDGVLCPKNKVLAHSLYNIAAAKNVPNAVQKRDSLAGEMKIEELTQAQDIAQNYQSSPSELTEYIRQTYGLNIRRYIDDNL